MDRMNEDGDELEQMLDCSESSQGKNKRGGEMHGGQFLKEEDAEMNTDNEVDGEHHDGGDKTAPLSRTQSAESLSDTHTVDSDSHQHEDTDKIDGGQNMCRICYGDSEDESLCSPCKCTGSIGFVHQSCMFHWIGGRPRMFCEICNHKYSIKRTTKAFLEWSYPWITHNDLYFVFMVIFSQEWIHVLESLILLISMYTINILTESSGVSIQFWVIIGLEIAYYCTHYICGLILLYVRKWSALNQQFSLLEYDPEQTDGGAWFSEDGSRLLYCLDMLVSFLLANPILKRMADKMVALVT